VKAGDVLQGSTPAGVLHATVEDRISAAQESKAVALGEIISSSSAEQFNPELTQQLRAMLEGASPDDVSALKELLFRHSPEKLPVSPDDELSANWRKGGYPYKNLMSRKNYEKQKYHLQVELLKLQAWVKESGQRILILFEGRDAAGKGGAIKRFMEHLNPRGARVMALEKPTETEQGQWYFQRYVQHLPSRGELVLCDRSWCNRAGVESVMGFCTDAEYQEFMRQAPEFERNLTRSGIHLIKFWFSVSRDDYLCGQFLSNRRAS